MLTVLACAGSAAAQIDTNSKAPIDITANTAEVQGSKCLAIWRGSAEALQAKARLRADTISVYSHPKGTSAGGQPDCGSTDRIVAEGHVYYVTADQRARADRAVYSASEDQIVMTGDVVVVQGQNVSRGNKLTIKVSTRQAVMDAPSGGRVRAVIYPNQGDVAAQNPK